MAPLQRLHCEAVSATAAYYAARDGCWFARIIQARTDASTTYDQFRELVLPMLEADNLDEVSPAILHLLRSPPVKGGTDVAE